MMRRVSFCVSAQPPTAAAATTALVVSGPLALLPTISEQSRGLKYAKTPHGFRAKRMGQRQFPLDRLPVPYLGDRHKFFTPDYWRQRAKHDEFLPAANYVCYDHTGRYWLPSFQTFTWQHALTTTPLRYKTYPLQYRIKNPSRWMVGTELFFWSKTKPNLIDETVISKKQRSRLVKSGLLPK